MKMLEQTITVLKAKESGSYVIQKESLFQLFGKVKMTVLISHSFGALDM